MAHQIPPLKRSETLTRQIIRDIVEHGWIEGHDLGNEQELLKRYRVARGTLLEAIHLLEWHGVVRVQLGTGGGLRVQKPGSYFPIYMLKTYFELAAVDPAALRHAHRLLQRALALPHTGAKNAPLGIFLRATDGLFVEALEGSIDRSGFPVKRSETIGYDLRLLIEDSRSGPGDRLGSESDLLKRFSVSRGALRSALRLMEVAGVLELRRGPAGGIFVGNMNPGFPIYVAAVFLSLANVPSSEIVSAQSGLLLLISNELQLPRDPQGALPRFESSIADTPLSRLRESAGIGCIIAEHLGNAPLAILMSIFERYWWDFYQPSSQLTLSADLIAAFDELHGSDGRPSPAQLAQV